MQAAKDSALTQSKIAGAPKTAKKGKYSTMAGVGDKMTTSKAAAAQG